MAAYGRLCTLFYDADKPRPVDAEVAWYAARLAREQGPVLELMSGSGRLLIPLLERGVRAHGVDSSPAMLASCAVRLERAGLDTALFRQDVAALNVPFRYAAAILAAGSFQLLTDPIAARAALERVRVHLVEPGRLFIDLLVPAEATHPPGAPDVHVRTVALPDGTRIALRSEVCVDIDAKRIDIRSRYEHRDRATLLAREDEKLAITWYEEDEIVTLLRDAGFRDIVTGPPAWPIEADAPRGERRFSATARA
jgi:hypothetical protein